MSDLKLYSFDGQALVRCETPEWLQKANSSTGEYHADLYSVGMHIMDDFGGDGDKVTVYIGNGCHYIEYWDVHERVAGFIIDDVANYLVFRARFMFPWVWLAREADRNAKEEEQSIRSRG